MNLYALSLSLLCATAAANPAEPPAPVAPASDLDAPLFYQLLIGELEWSQGQPATAYVVLLDAARRTQDPELFRRAMEMAMQAKAGPEALQAAQGWRQARPQDIDPLRAQVQILLAMNRLPALIEPMQHWLSLTPAGQRPDLLAGLPGLFRHQNDHKAVLGVMQVLLTPYMDGREGPAARQAAQLAMARVLRQAGQSATALAMADHVSLADPGAPGPAVLAIDLLNDEAQAEAIVQRHLGQTAQPVQPWVRLAFAQWLGSRERYAEALEQTQRAVVDLPYSPPAWFALGSLQMELRQTQEAETSLKRFVELATGMAQGAGPAAGLGPDTTTSLVSARLMLSQLAADRGDFERAQQWLQALEGDEPSLELQTRRALLLARQGKVEPARALIRAVPGNEPDDLRQKALAEAQVLRTVERWKDARSVLAAALERAPTDVELMYELALTVERLGQHAEMERRLRRVMELQPDHAHAHNALGYSYVERGIKLDEASTLIKRALELLPGDAFITDSLAWLEFKLGRTDLARQLLQQAYKKRPDAEIGVHLGEVLWVLGQRDEARKVWREVRERDKRNRLLASTLTRLKADL